MLTAAADLLLTPTPSWWSKTWLLPWYAACLAALGWALARAREKRAAPGVVEWDRAA
ncbi:hypothetical protein [Streptomyces sp. B93]|uniref:hypothetical protein n=1 Tax=Streptomyces sp. B93 TaxID=2824875 RepID=UPI001FFD42A3|nr:hypothetical protein [Streptomyces sp. B93]